MKTLYRRGKARVCHCPKECVQQISKRIGSSIFVYTGPPSAILSEPDDIRDTLQPAFFVDWIFRLQRFHPQILPQSLLEFALKGPIWLKKNSLAKPISDPDSDHIIGTISHQEGRNLGKHMAKWDHKTLWKQSEEMNRGLLQCEPIRDSYYHEALERIGEMMLQECVTLRLWRAPDHNRDWNELVKRLKPQ